MPRLLTPIYPRFSGHAPVGRSAHRYPHGVALIPYRIGVHNIPDPIPLPPLPGLPTVSPATFSLSLPTQVGAGVGQCLASNNPTSWRITSGNTESFWAINSDGILIVLNLGMFGGVHYEITVIASNAAGNSRPEPIFISTSGSVET
jgi:hypothetical protein